MATDLRPDAAPDRAPAPPASMTTAPVAARDRMGGMVPGADLLPEVLPTERLTASGMPRPFLREQLRTVHNGRNVANLVSIWLQSFGVVAVACWATPQLPLVLAVPVWVVAFLLMGRAFALYSILAHEAAHRLLFSRKRWNDLAGRWLLAYPAFIPFEAYRRSHFAHHKEEFGPTEPDLNLYNGYPITRASWRRKLWRDARGTTGWKNLKGLLFALRSATARPVALKIVAAQGGVWVLLLLIGGLSRWWLYPLLWLAPWLTVWRVLNRLRAVAEHGGMTASPDRRRTTHVVHQSWAARFWIVPFNTGWHLAHHVDMGVPFQQLPALHDELVAAGWVTDRLEHDSYVSFWRAASAA